MYIREILKYLLHRPVHIIILPFPLPVTPFLSFLFAVFLFPFFFVRCFPFPAFIGLVSPLKREGKQEGEQEGKRARKSEAKWEGKREGAQSLTARGNMSRVPSRNTLRKCVYSVTLGGFCFTESKLDHCRAG